MMQRSPFKIGIHWKPDANEMRAIEAYVNNKEIHTKGWIEFNRIWDLRIARQKARMWQFYIPNLDGRLQCWRNEREVKGKMLNWHMMELCKKYKAKATREHNRKLKLERRAAAIATKPRIRVKAISVPIDGTFQSWTPERQYYENTIH